jgi:hypothetical protein
MERREVYRITCPKCGSFEMSGVLLEDFDEGRRPREDRELLALALVNASTKGISLPVLDRDNFWTTGSGLI